MAGSTVLAREPLGRVRVSTEMHARHPNAFFCQIDGEGMSRVVPDGALVLIDPDVEPGSGSIVAVEVDGEPYVRRWHRGNDTLLLSADGYVEREDMVFRGSDTDSVLLLGTVVWFQASREMS